MKEKMLYYLLWKEKLIIQSQKNFIIKQIDKSLAKYLVFGTTAESPLFQLIEIQNDRGAT